MAHVKDVQRSTLIMSVVFSAFGPLVTGWAVTMNTAATQLADFVRRSLEFAVLVFALYVYLRVRQQDMTASRRTVLERRIAKLAAVVLWFGASFLLWLFIRGLLNPTYPEGSVLVGLSIAVLGLLFNVTFYVRYRTFHRRNGDAVMGTQSRLYQAKTMADMNVILALLAVLIFGASSLTLWVDRLGSLIIAGYLMIRGGMMLRQAQLS